MYALKVLPPELRHSERVLPIGGWRVRVEAVLGLVGAPQKRHGRRSRIGRDPLLRYT